MSERKKQIFLEAIKKSKKESVMGKLANGDTDPMEPWSKKHAPLDEVNTQVLWKYIKAMGRDPKTIPLADRLNLARTDKFKKFSRDHAKFTDVGESVEQIDEAGTGLLMSFIKAKGLDPRSMDGNQKNKYSKSSEYKTFKHRRVEASGMGERGEDWNEEKKPVKEAVDAKDTVTMDIPLLIRVLEYAREDAKTDMDLHKVVENLINMRKDTLTMHDYDSIVSIKEEVEIQEAFDGSKVRIHSPGHEMHGKIGRVFDRHEDGRVNAQFEMGPKKHQVRNYTLKPGQFKEVTNEDVEQIDELKKQSDTQDLDSHITKEDLRKWFNPKHPEGGWKRINSKGEAIGPCAREPGEPKPKCMSNEKRAKLSKKERASAVAAKRKHDPVADRAGKGGKPVNVSNFGKGKISEEETNEACWDTHKQVGMKKKGNKMVPNCVPKNEEVEMIDEKNSPTNPKLWARAKSLARSKFDVYPSAYANGWASKWYKSKGGGWKATKEEVEIEEQRTSNDPRKSGTFEKQPDGSFKRVSNLDKLKRRLMQKHGDKLKKKINEGIYGIEDSPMSATNSVKAMESRMAKEKSKSARIIKAIYRKKGIKETLYDWEKSEKGGSKEADAKIIIKGGKTMTGQERDTVEIDPVLKTKLNSPNGRPN
jgi:hypothetical protein